jgi:hypothetical protein
MINLGSVGVCHKAIQIADGGSKSLPVRKKLLASALFAPYKNSAMLVATALLTTFSTIRALPASLT